MQKEAKDFTTDNRNIYIAYKDKVQVIEAMGKLYLWRIMGQGLYNIIIISCT